MKRLNLSYLEILLALSFGLTFTYIAFKFFHFNLGDEWLGRGLYPGLAFFHGLDFYEPKTGPHVTLYGWATGLFYMFSGLGSTPDQAALIAYLSNLTAIFIVLFFIFRKSGLNSETFSWSSSFEITSLISLVFVFAFLDPTTDSLYRVHSDTPALFFLFLSIGFLQVFHDKQNQIYLFLVALSLCLSFWSKLPTLPSCILPIVYFTSSRQWKFCRLYILHLLTAIFLTVGFVSIYYGFTDSKFILLDHISDNKWSDRNSLFNGKGAALLDMNYFEAIPLLFRFFILYLEHYWILVLSILGIFFLSFSNQINYGVKFLLRFLFLGYCLTLPPCLAALAHFGSVENALFFANFIGIVLIVIGIHSLLKLFQKTFKNSVILWLIALFLCLPTLRTAKSILLVNNSLHEQAFQHLESGNNDIYFGWYPISHLMSNGENYTSIEVPTWVGMTRPHELAFDKKHFPRSAKYLATCKIGYGKTILQRYLGNLEEVDAPKSLSHWRLFKITK